LLGYFVSRLCNNFVFIIQDVFAGKSADQLFTVIRQLPDNFNIRRFDKTVAVNASIGGQTADKTDVGAFRSLDGANPAVMRIMYVAHIETGPVA
jgi:hypothetical protein